MADFGVLKSMKECLSLGESTQLEGEKIPIYFFAPEALPIPCITLDLEEVWTSPMAGKGDVVARVRIKAEAIGDKGRAFLSMNKWMRSSWDGVYLSLDKGLTGIVRLDGTIMGLSGKDAVQKIQHHYTIMVR